jgi:hypothetical protein
MPSRMWAKAQSAEAGEHDKSPARSGRIRTKKLKSARRLVVRRETEAPCEQQTVNDR